MNSQSHYPNFDVMREAPEWDDHTREIVKKRLDPDLSFVSLEPNEVSWLLAVSGTLVDDHREEILAAILRHIDNHLKSEIGESQRGTGTPREADLIRNGLAAINITARNTYGEDFPQLALIQRQTLLGRVERNELPGIGPWSGIPQKQWFNKLLNLTVEAYYSHPTIWSEIGYAGPAYPRGYVRSELGLADPWEPKPEASSVSQKE